MQHKGSFYLSEYLTYWANYLSLEKELHANICHHESRNKNRLHRLP